MAAGQSLCRECLKPVGDIPRLMLARGSVKGTSSVCFRCVAKLSGYEQELLDWLPGYIQAQVDPVTRLRKENDDLRAQNARMKLALEDAAKQISKYK